MLQILLVWISIFLSACCEGSFLEPRQLTRTLGFSDQGTCVAMANQGTHFTVDVHVGTPPQTFSVVADTGSNNLIVPSCICRDNHACSAESRCFQGTNRSSTFQMNEIMPGQGPPSMLLSFGSGDIQAAIVGDVVQIGDLQANMNHSLLVMVDQRLSIPGPFEGILGLGMPEKNKTHLIYNSSEAANGGGSGEKDVSDTLGEDDIEKIIEQIMDGYGGDSALKVGERLAPVSEHQLFTVQQAPKSVAKVEQPVIKEIPQPISFLEEVGIGRFSMCFNDAGTNGTLRIGTGPLKAPLSSIGYFHWGLGLEGIAVGENSVPVSICGRDNMTKGQQTPCGAIPDSGTTAIMGPADGLELLMDSLCDAWDRCHTNHTMLTDAKADAIKAVENKAGFDPFGISDVEVKKSDILQLLLQECGEWLTEEKGVDELPPIKFQLSGKSGDQQTITLSAWAYVIEMEQPVMEQVEIDIPGFGKIPMGMNATDRVEKVCTLSFGDMGYKTQQNGDVWILGGPLFYEYNVGYDLFSKPPSISFDATKDTPCTTCGQEGIALTSQTAERTSGRQIARRPRQIHGPMRKPNIDVTLPL